MTEILEELAVAGDRRRTKLSIYWLAYQSP